MDALIFAIMRYTQGGSCNPTTWRRDICIPKLAAAEIPFYNPQVDEWHPALVDIETDKKNEASVLFFVIDSQTRAIASMLEVASLIAVSKCAHAGALCL